MNLSEKNKDDLLDVFSQVLSDVEITDADIVPVGYCEYDIEWFNLSIDENILLDAVISVLER